MAERAMIEDLPLHVAGLRRYALALTGSPFQAEDLVQDTLIRAVAAPAASAREAHEGDLTYALVGNTSEQQLVAIAMRLGADQPHGWL
jgi:DNA-directed RNA polymerase specialized sigma24 family protein